MFENQAMVTHVSNCYSLDQTIFCGDRLKYSGMPICQTFTGNDNWLKRSGVRDMRGTVTDLRETTFGSRNQDSPAKRYAH